MEPETVEPTEMELRVADVIQNESGPWMNELSAAQSLIMARAAIRAMRLVNDKTLAAGVATDQNEDMECLSPLAGMRLVWEAMIDAASPPTE